MSCKQKYSFFIWGFVDKNIVLSRLNKHGFSGNSRKKERQAFS